MTTQDIGNPEGYAAPDDVDYSSIAPGYKGSLFVSYDEAGDITHLLTYSEDEFAINDGVSGWESGKDEYATVLDQPFRSVRTGMEDQVIKTWEESEGVDPEGLPWTIDQFSPYFA